MNYKTVVESTQKAPSRHKRGNLSGYTLSHTHTHTKPNGKGVNHNPDPESKTKQTKGDLAQTSLMAA